MRDVFVNTLVLGVLLVTGCHSQTVQQQHFVRNGSITAVSTMSTQRASHTATLISSSKVLIAGGFVNGGEAIASAEIYDESTRSFLPIVNMSVARASHTATVLTDGKILITGGFNGEYLDSAEVYDPKSGKFEPVGRMVVARSGHVATLMKDGTVLMAGGVGKDWTFLASSEIYDPRTNRFASTGPMTTERESHTANVLKDGRVLITGGHKGRRSSIIIYSSSEIYDPKRKTFSLVRSLNSKRHKHEAVLLNDGRVLVLGGSDERDGEGAYRNAEIYDPNTGAFSNLAQTMSQARYKLQGAVVRLNDGRILVAGGSDRGEVFDPATNSFNPVEGVMGSKRLFSTATLMGNGHVLIVGGYHSGSNNVSDGAWIYRI